MPLTHMQSWRDYLTFETKLLDSAEPVATIIALLLDVRGNHFLGELGKE